MDSVTSFITFINKCCALPRFQIVIKIEYKIIISKLFNKKILDNKLT